MDYYDNRGSGKMRSTGKNIYFEEKLVRDTIDRLWDQLLGDAFQSSMLRWSMYMNMSCLSCLFSRSVHRLNVEMG